ncbi:MAG: ribonuclease HII [Parcubacteria group bacterium LiPW_39]|nr:MAG: ribonuclease HII [Parcubacteria group bacterium LiPW_39]
MVSRKRRIFPNFYWEHKLWRRGYKVVAGLDEAGRGPLAGPVCAAVVCFCAQKQTTAAKFKIQPRIKYGAKFKILENIQDSKRLTFRQREQWYKILTSHDDIKWGIGMVSQKIIDKINILEATKLAMKWALENLEIEPEYLLLDGNFLLDGLNINQKAVRSGDEKIISCAAASIIAKVTRDRLMIRYHKKYPRYGFNQHKGYGTRAHFTAIKKHGPCRIHRLSFAPFS